MIYPQKIKNKKIDYFFKICSYIVIVILIVLLIINKLTTPNIYWSNLCVISCIYINLTVRYTVTKTTNIAMHLVIQVILLSLLMYFIDYQIGYKGWSISISYPIIIIISNIFMFIITLISYKSYEKYSISQLIMLLLSLLIVFFLYKGYTKANFLIKISLVVSMLNFLVSLVVNHRDFKEEITRKFNR